MLWCDGRYERGSFGGGGGNSRWQEEPREEDDWSKQQARNERLEKWVIVTQTLKKRPWCSTVLYFCCEPLVLNRGWESDIISCSFPVSCFPAATQESILRNMMTFPWRQQDTTALIPSIRSGPCFTCVGSVVVTMHQWPSLHCWPWTILCGCLFVRGNPLRR